MNESASTTPIADAVAPPRARRGVPLYTKIFLGLLVGTALGLLANLLLGPTHPAVQWTIANVTRPVGQLFLRLLLMAVIPLVFTALVVGVAEVGDIRRVGRVGLKTFVYTLGISAISVAIGIGLANTVRPGERIDRATAAALQAEFGQQARQVAQAKIETEGKSVLTQVVETLVPVNPVAAVASETPNLLHLMFFALALGVAATLVRADVVAPLLRVLTALYETTAKFIGLVMRVAPYAVACLLFSTTAGFGLDLLRALGWYVLTVLTGLALHMFGVYSLAVALLARYSPLEFFRRLKTVIVTAFSTSSSNATLPTALEVTERNLGVPREITSFVLTVGATANQNGTALFEGVTVLFLAQLAGVDLTLGQQILVAYLAILGGIGTAGIPSGSLPFVAAVLASVGVNPALIAIILGIDRILDMCRTTLNVVGDVTAAAYVARSEGYALRRGPEASDALL